LCSALLGVQMKIYYQDKDIAVCEKPYGIPSQLSDKENMVTMLEGELGCSVFPVHRLDTTTTGLMVFALNKKSAASLSNTVATGSLDKEYYAVVHGNITTQGRMIDYLYHDRISNKSFVTKGERKGSKRAELEYFPIASTLIGDKMASLVRIKLYTGRTHQIRVQMANIGSPLFGDGKYGAKDNCRICLHSSRLSFPHPVSGKTLEFISMPQGDTWDAFKTEK